MRHKYTLGGLRFLLGVLLLMLCTTSAPLRARQSGTGQTRAIADIVLAVVTCSSHPCLGEDGEEFGNEMRGKMASDGAFYYSDLTVAYPGARGLLHGEVEWDLGAKVKEVDLRVTELEIDPADLLKELEHALPGCLMEQEDEEDMDGADEDATCGGDGTCAWSCEAQGYSSSNVTVDVYYIEGLAIIELSP